MVTCLPLLFRRFDSTSVPNLPLGYYWPTNEKKGQFGLTVSWDNQTTAVWICFWAFYLEEKKPTKASLFQFVSWLSSRRVPKISRNGDFDLFFWRLAELIATHAQISHNLFMQQQNRPDFRRKLAASTIRGPLIQRRDTQNYPIKIEWYYESGELPDCGKSGIVRIAKCFQLYVLFWGHWILPQAAETKRVYAWFWTYVSLSFIGKYATIASSQK